MTFLVNVMMTIVCGMVAVAAIYGRRGVTSAMARDLLMKVALGALGSAVIVWFVYFVAELLQMIVVVFAILWLGKQLLFNGPLLRAWPIRLIWQKLT